MIVRVEDLVVEVDLEACSRQPGDRVGQRIGDRGHIHVRPQALRVQADDEPGVGAPRRPEPDAREHVGVGQDLCRHAPPSLDSSAAPRVSVITAAA